MKFSQKLIVLFLGIMIPASIAISYCVYASNLKSLKRQIKHRLEDSAFHVMDKIDRTLFQKLVDIEILAGDSIICSRDSTPKQITERLMECKKLHKKYVSLSFCNTDSVIVADTDRLNIARELHKSKCVEKALQGNMCKNGEICIQEDSEVLQMEFAAPVRDENGEVIGAVLSRLSMAVLYQITEQACGIDEYHVETKDMEIDLVDRNGLLLYSNYNKKGIFKDNLADYESVRRSMAGEKIGILTHYEPFSKENDVFVFVREQGYLDFQGNGWTLLLHTPTKIAFSPAIRLRNRMIVILSVVIVLIIAVSLIFSHMISKPISKLKNAAAEIGKGKLDTKIEITSRDEIGSLAQSFNEMVLNLNKVTASRDALNIEITERKKAEEDLKKSEEKFRSIFNNANIMIFGTDSKGNLQYFNKKAEKVLGYSQKEAIGMNNMLLHPPEQRKEILEKFRVHVSGKLKENLELGYITKSGKRLVGSMAQTIFTDSTGKEWFFGLVQDITERKKGEEEIIRAKEEWERTFMTVPDLIAIINKQHRIVRVNKAMGERMGVAPDEAMGMICYECIHGTKEPPNFCPLTKLLADGQEHTEEIYEEHLSCHFIVSVSPLRDDDGSLLGCVHIARDITERKQTEMEKDALRKNLESLWGLAQLAEQDLNTLCDYVLKEIAEITASRYVSYGFLSEDESEDIVYSWSPDVMEECKMQDKPRIFPVEKAGLWANAIRNRAPMIINDYDKAHPGKKGLPEGHVPLKRLMVVPVFSKGRITALAIVANKEAEYQEEDIKQLSAFITSAQTIIDRKKAEEKARQRQTELIHVSRLSTIGQMASELAHELNQPLCATLAHLEGSLNMVKSDSSDTAKIIRKMETAIKQIDRAGKIVSRVKSFAMKGMGKRSTVFINNVIHDSMDFMEREIQYHHIASELDLDEKIQPVFADPIQIEQVISNLIQNAIEAMADTPKEQRKLTIVMKMLIDSLEVAVKDTGKGISKDEMENIFDSFFTTKNEGLGIGLSISKSIVESHNGRIYFRQNPGHGVTFFFTLPLRAKKS